MLFNITKAALPIPLSDEATRLESIFPLRLARPLLQPYVQGTGDLLIWGKIPKPAALGHELAVLDSSIEIEDTGDFFSSTNFPSRYTSL